MNATVVSESLVATGVIVRRHENQPRASFGEAGLRGTPAGLQDADNHGIGRENTDPNGECYRNAENERHEERNHGQPPLLECNSQMPQALLWSTRFLQFTRVCTLR
jgi:hypothetical protein